MLAELTRQSPPDPFLDFGQALVLPEICPSYSGTVEMNAGQPEPPTSIAFKFFFCYFLAFFLSDRYTRTEIGLSCFIRRMLPLGDAGNDRKSFREPRPQGAPGLTRRVAAL